MRILLGALALSLSVPAPAAETAQSSKPAQGLAQQAPKAAAYTSADTEIGVLLDDPAAKAVLEKYVPGLTTSSQIDMARGMTLKAIQPYAADDITDAKLASIDAELAKLPPAAPKH